MHAAGPADARRLQINAREVVSAVSVDVAGAVAAVVDNHHAA